MAGFLLFPEEIHDELEGMTRTRMPRIGVFILATLLSACTSLFAEDSPKDLDIYLLIGQSNMAGRAPYSEEEAQVLDHCYLLNAEDVFEPASIPFNRYSTIRKDIKMQKLNPGYAFAKTMLKAEPDTKLGLVVNAKGGSSIKEWAKGKSFYTEAIRRTQDAMQYGTLKGILWHQGETDCNDPKYLERIEALIANLRADLNAPDLPFIAGQITQSGDYLFNSIILELPEKVPYTGVVSSDGLTVMDKWHFDNPSALELGKRYAEKMLEVQSTLPK